MAKGIFKNASATAVKFYPTKHRLPVTGIADIPMIALTAELTTVPQQIHSTALEFNQMALLNY